jgi:hypothetical protein
VLRQVKTQNVLKLKTNENLQKAIATFVQQSEHSTAKRRSVGSLHQLFIFQLIDHLIEKDFVVPNEFGNLTKTFIAVA